MFKPFNDFKEVKIVKAYNGKELIISIQEECGVDTRDELNFNLIEIYFYTDSPFNSVNRINQFKGEKHNGYMVDIQDNKIFRIDLIISNMGWGETDTIKEETEEFYFVQSLLKEVGALQ